MAEEDINQPPPPPPIAPPEAPYMVSFLKLPVLKKGYSSQAQGSSLFTNELMFSFFSNKSSSPHLDNEDLEQIDQDDLEEMGLKWQVECFNCHRRGNFTKDCRITKNTGNMSRDAGNVGYGGRDNGKRPAREEDEKALREKLRKANLEIVGYQYGLESIEGQLRVHQQNEVIYEEKIRVLEYDIKDKSNFLKYTQKQLDEALREKEDLKAKLEKFDTSSKNLTKLLNSQISEKVKTGLDYNSQFNEKEVLDVKEEEVTETVLSVWPRINRGQLRVHQQNEVIYEEKIRVLEYNIKDKSNLLKYTQKQLDEALREKEDLKAKLEKFDTSSKNLTKLLNSQISVKVKTGLDYDSQFNEKEVLDVKEEEVTETVFDNRLSDEENSLANNRFKKGKGYHEVPHPLTGNYMPRKPDLSFAGLDDSIYKFKIIFTRFGRIPVSVAKPKATASTSASKPVNTVGPKQSVNSSKSRSTFHKSHSPIRRSFYNETAHSRSNLTERVNTARSKAVSAVKGNWVTAVKASAGNQTNKNANPQDTRGNAGTQDNVDAGKEVSDQHHIVLPLWSAISSAYKSSYDKAEDDKPKDNTSSRTVVEPVNKEDQAYRDELDRLIINAASTSGTFSAGGPSFPHPDAFIPDDTLLHLNQDDSQIPDLEDTAELRITIIFHIFGTIVLILCGPTVSLLVDDVSRLDRGGGVEMCETERVNVLVAVVF
uniref:CCHC-type domain-containing protein n=1 Tax=Tanacetum cinerariifolium TaxID=118510 RepID=A0A6L2MP61_TANCI|nr:hypothetical protein [Tanacetum cinerariifolium]